MEDNDEQIKCNLTKESSALCRNMVEVTDTRGFVSEHLELAKNVMRNLSVCGNLRILF